MKNFYKKFLAFLVIMTSIVCLAGCGTTQTEISVDSIQISKKNIYLAEGQTAVISAQVYPFNANNQNVVWSSTNDSVVKIEDGFITALKAGDAVIEVVSEDGGYKDTCNVLVTTADNNLALNDYNNLNMPPKELAPIYTPQSAKNTKFKELAGRLATKVSAQVDEEKQSALKVVENIKTDLQNSINFFDQQKQTMASTVSASTFENVFNNIKNQMFEGIKAFKQEMINELTNAEQKIESDEYTVKQQDVNGVTFVVIKNN